MHQERKRKEKQSNMSTSAAIDLLTGKFVSLVENEVAIQQEVHEKVEQIMDELETMKSFLKDSEKKGVHSELEKTWVAKVRDMANHVEDIIDEFTYQTNRLQTWNKFSRIVHTPKDLWFKRQITGKLQNINAKIKEIPERNQRYGVVDIESTSSNKERVKIYGESSLFLKDDDLVGNADAKEKLTGWLRNGDKQRVIISVVGMAGSGKTTLVANIFNAEDVKRHFDCYAWITVSETYTVDDLLRSMVKEFYKVAVQDIPLNLGNMSYRDLLEVLVNYLQAKRYLVVLDDVWSLNLWREISVALPDGPFGSRVMITTRKEDIACFPFGYGSHVHHVQPLQLDEAWDLFCMKAFSGTTSKSCPPKLMSIAKRLVEKCKGLPLGIVSLGSLMSTKLMMESEWRKVYNSLNWELSNNPKLEDVKSILLLSFNDLPFRLKHCFLYCCLFPEDYEMQRKRLLRLWIAEGFVEQVKGLSLEENAESYLMELISRSLLQVVERNSDGRPKTCKMHDLLRELALSISETEMFCTVLTSREAMEDSRARRLSILALDKRLGAYKNLLKVRTLFVFLPDMTSSSMDEIASGFRMLKVLDLKDLPIVKLPYDLAHCFNLKYLNLKGTGIKELPKCIRKLHNLQTLDIRRSEIKVIPDWITKLKNLRHLLMYYHSADQQNVLAFQFVSGTQAPPGICELENLQVLDCVQGGNDLIVRLQYMTQLTRLGLTGVREAHKIAFCTSIGKMKLLHHLFVKTTHESEVLPINSLSSTSVPPLLETLVLHGRLAKVPIWFGSLLNLTTLELHYSRLEEDLLLYIQGLPNLVDLRLVTTYTGDDLRFTSGFQKLSYLALCNFPWLTTIDIQEGVMPNIQQLEIIDCVKLKSLPLGIEHLSKLRELNFLNAPFELIERIRREGSVDRHRVQHIAKINSVSKTDAEWSTERL